MRQYETVFLFDPGLADDQLNAEVEKIKKIILDEKGVVIEVKNWGMRQTSYLINRKRSAAYVYMKFEANPSAQAEYERRFKLDEAITRHLTLAFDPVELPDVTQPKVDRYTAMRRKIIPRELVSISLGNYVEFPLRRFVTDRGKIIPRRITRVSSEHQRRITRALKHARFLGMVSYVDEVFQ